VAWEGPEHLWNPGVLPHIIGVFMVSISCFLRRALAKALSWSTLGMGGD
jgi:hypothetical protein